MRSADEFRVCQFPLPEKPSKICAEPLHGRGRWKWCASHSELVRQEQNKARDAQWQRKWRARHTVLCKNQQLIYRLATKVQDEILGNFPAAPPTAIYANVLKDFREAFKEAGCLSRERKAKGSTRAITDLNWDYIKLANTGAVLSVRCDGRREVFFHMPVRQCWFITMEKGMVQYFAEHKDCYMAYFSNFPTFSESKILNSDPSNYPARGDSQEHRSMRRHSTPVRVIMRTAE